MAIRAVHLELENQQRIKDAKTLRFMGSQEHRLRPLIFFRSVKFQSSDWDGMRSVRRRYNARVHSNSFRPTPAPTSPLPATLALAAESASLRSRIQLLQRPSRFSPTHDSDSPRSARTTPMPSVYSVPPSSSTSVRRPHRTARPQATARSTEYLSALATPALIVRPVTSPPAPMRPPPTPPSCGMPRRIAETSLPRCSPAKVLFSAASFVVHPTAAISGVRAAHPRSLPLVASAAPNK
ncbi:hypothetical protein K438DRAFT_2025948 [Mycena galopus ATCC 62051]|nr:hypothetical protein K438DRAFT_2025948 [Mycena galopus ATCC 62051]